MNKLNISLDKLKILLKNIMPKNNQGKIYITKDDEWINEDIWDDDYNIIVK